MKNNNIEDKKYFGLENVFLKGLAFKARKNARYKLQTAQDFIKEIDALEDAAKYDLSNDGESKAAEKLKDAVANFKYRMKIWE